MRERHKFWTMVCISLVALTLFVVLYSLPERQAVSGTLEIILVVFAFIPWLALFVGKLSAGKDGVSFEARLDQNDDNIEYIIRLIKFVLTKNQLAFLHSLEGDRSWVVEFPGAGIHNPYYEGFKDDALRLRGLGMIKNKTVEGTTGEGFSELEKGRPGKRDASLYFRITDEGSEYLGLRSKLEGFVSGRAAAARSAR